MYKASTFSSLATLQRGFDLPLQDRSAGQFPIISSAGQTGSHAQFMVKGPGVVTGRSGTIGLVHYTEGDFWPLNTTLYVKDFKGNLPKYVALVLEDMDLKSHAAGSTVPSLNRNVLDNVPVRIPTLDEQRRIVDLIDVVDVGINAAALLYRDVSRLLDAKISNLYASTSLIKLDEIGDTITGFPFRSAEFTLNPADKRLLRNDNVGTGRVEWENVRYLPQDKIISRHDRYDLVAGDIVVSLNRPLIKAGTKASVITEGDVPSFLVQRVARVRLFDPLNLPVVFGALHSEAFRQYISEVQKAAGHVPMLSGSQVGEFQVPDPRGLETARELITGLNAVKEAAEEVMTRTESLRTEVLSALLSGAHRIPETYDELMRA